MKTHTILIALLSFFSLAFGVEPVKHTYGWKGDSPGKQAAPPIKLTGFAAATIQPTSDLRSKMPPVYDQGQLGSCTGNGIAACLDFAHHNSGAMHTFDTPSRLFIYYNERFIENTVTQDAGAEIVDGITSVQKQGACTERTWGYNIAKFKARPSTAAYSEALKFQAIHAYKLDNGNGVDIRKALSVGYPVVWGGYVYQAIENLTSTNYTLTLPKKGERPIGGHCMVVVGHDDARQLYTVRNSWGEGYAYHGHLLIPYAYLHNTKICDDFWVIDVAE